MTLRAVDLSHVKTITNWDALCGFADILILKATEGSPEGTAFLDPLFTSRLAEARRRRKLIGIYHYVGSSVVRKVYSAASEADWFASNYAWRPGEVPIADYEPVNPPADQDGWLAAFLHRLTGRGWPVPMSYMNTSAAASSTWAKTRALGSALWVARYFANNGQVPAQQPSPGPFGTYAMWQYTSNGAVPGVTGPVDVSLFYGTTQAWLAFGKGGSPTPTPSPPPTPSVQEDDMRVLRDPNGTVWLATETSVSAISNQTLSVAAQKVWGGIIDCTAAEVAALAADANARRNSLLTDVQRSVLCATPSDRSGAWLWDRVAGVDDKTGTIADAVGKVQTGGVDPAEVAALVLAGLNGAQLNVQQAPGK